ncbi:MAG TPA: His/Gly/Thr/Pro-type tRNA ligase C-terminal domain-containing protein, partial [Mesotoga infera]|nr:His/Gly/Thr/Pro-type tRNA ligase C-terminal domain-containing protein [Mesotoga infera]
DEDALLAIVEQLHDKDGMIWPLEAAPFDIIVTAVNTKDEEIMKRSVEIYELLKKRGYDVLLDDRETSPGMKFKDADLIGIPVRVTLGKKLAEGIVEIKSRTEEKPVMVSVNDGYGPFVEEVERLFASYNPKSVLKPEDE